MSHIETIPPQRAVELVQQGAVLIDIREVAEHTSENIPGARITLCRKSAPRIRFALATAF
jgi:rhodanese-related sulfurtransferase